MTSSLNSPDKASLDSRLATIHERPLENRAAAFVQLHDELQARLEGADLPAGADA